MKRLMAMLLVCSLLVGLVPGALAEETEEVYAVESFENETEAEEWLAPEDAEEEHLELIPGFAEGLGILPEEEEFLEEETEDTGDDPEIIWLSNVFNDEWDPLTPEEREELISRPIEPLADEEIPVFYSIQSAAAYVHSKYNARSGDFTIKIMNTGEPDINVLNKAIKRAACVHTGSPTDGDYLYWEEIGSNGYARFDATNYSYTIYFRPVWRTSDAQERVLAQQLNSVISGMKLTGKSNYEKVRAINDYICKHTTYDYDHDSTYRLRGSAYAAQVDKSATCLGYASLAYRMLLMVGVDNRLVDNIAHSWNLVDVDGGYFYIDTTWDAPNGASGRNYRYFLTCESNFNNSSSHDLTGTGYFDSVEFRSRYPVSPVDYETTFAKTVLSAPKLKSTSAELNGIKLTWDPVSGASGYRVIYKAAGDSWWRLAGETTGTSFTVPNSTVHAKDYTVSVAAKNSSGMIGLYDTTGLTRRFIKAPQILSRTNTVGGVKVEWESLSGVPQYAVFYKTVGGSWVKCADVAGTSYVVTGLQSGTDYCFTVRCLNSAGNSTSSYRSDSPAIRYIAAPAGITLTNGTSGITVRWSAVPGAQYYAVFQKNDAGAWVRRGITSGTSCTISGITPGKSCTFTVRCSNADGTEYISGYDGKGATITYMQSCPPLSAPTNELRGVRVRWTAVSGIQNYAVFVKTAGSSWKQVGMTTGTTFLVSGLTEGTSYTFTVRGITADGKTYTTYYDTAGKTITRTQPMPQISNLAPTDAGVRVTWGAVPGAESYAVFTKVGSENWQRRLITQGTSCEITGLTPGTTYGFTVRCISSDGQQYTSGYRTGSTFTWTAKPVLTSAENTVDGVTVKWNAVSGGQKYALFMKTTGGWIQKGITDKTTYTFTGLTSGTTYQFVVRSISADGKTYISTYDTAGKTVTYLAAPEISKTEPTDAGVRVTWNAVAGAQSYAVFTRIGNANWQRRLITQGTSCELTGLTPGTTYGVTVRCISADGRTYTSGYRTGSTIIWTAKPVLTAAANAVGGVTVKWNAVSGGQKYALFMKTTGGWIQKGITDQTTYTFTGLTSGTTYRFTVRSISADGKKYISTYDATGKTVTYLAVPEITKLESLNEGVRVTWKAVPGAERYAVFVKTGSGWQQILHTNATSCLLTRGIRQGEVCTVAVRCIDAAGKNYTSAYDPNGKSILWNAPNYAEDIPILVA